MENRGNWLLFTRHDAVLTALNQVPKRSIIRIAAEVAGLTFGKDFVVEFLQ